MMANSDTRWHFWFPWQENLMRAEVEAVRHATNAFQTLLKQPRSGEFAVLKNAVATRTKNLFLLFSTACRF
jgi:hypothetical protein